MSLTKGAMVVLSGGQDSTTCLGWALEHFDRVAAVSFDYGQKHNIELQCAEDIVNFFDHQTGREIPHEIVSIGAHTFAGTSPLTNKEEALELYENHDQMAGIIGDRVEKTFVPMRNAVFLMLAANRAVVGDYDTLVTGVCQEDNANYPDCRKTFVDLACLTIREALGVSNFFIETPLMYLSKAETVELAYRTPHTYRALALSHTAYNGEYPPTGKDHASVLRAHGFEQAGMPDPLVVRAWREGLMELPNTPNYEANMKGWELL